jgi:hypothetical protein
MQIIEINGKEYPFAFTYKCMRELQKAGEDLNELEMGEKAFALAINKGYKRNDSKQKITEAELIDLLDEDPAAFQRLSDALTHDMNVLSGGKQ